MSIWMRVDAEKVYMNISGDVFKEHVDFLGKNLQERLRYGYRNITVNVNDVSSFAPDGLLMLRDIRDRVLKIGGNLIVEDKNGVIGQWV